MNKKSDASYWSAVGITGAFIGAVMALWINIDPRNQYDLPPIDKDTQAAVSPELDYEVIRTRKALDDHYAQQQQEGNGVRHASHEEPATLTR